jgi:hypothetical protein
MSDVDEDRAILRQRLQPLPRRAIARESAVITQMLALVPAVGVPSFEYSSKWRCFVLSFLQLKPAGDANLRGGKRTVAKRIRFVPTRFDTLGILGYLALAVAAPLGLVLAAVTHTPEVAFSGVAVGAFGLLTVVSRPRVIRPDLHLLLEVIRNERSDALSAVRESRLDSREWGEDEVADLEKELRAIEEKRVGEERLLALLQLVVSAHFLRVLLRWSRR